jgi:hypothetical protein
MPKMRGLLHSRPKIDEEEAALAQSRVSARLVDLFGDGAPAPKEAPLAEDSSAEAVEDPDRGDTAAMPWWVPIEPGPLLGLPRPPIVVEGEDQRVGAHADMDEVQLVAVMARTDDEAGDDGWAPLLAGPTERAPGPGQGDATTVDEAAVAKSAEPDAPAAIRPVPAPVEPPRAAPTRPSRQGSREDRRGRSSAGRSPASRPSKRKVRPATVPLANCPYCALLMQPPPASSRRCDRCRQRIIFRRVEGRAVYLTEAAVLVFEAERRRVAASGRLTRERDRWLRLAAAAGAPAPRQARLAAAPLSEGVVDAARALYIGTVDRAFRAAKREKDWESASRIRREQATALYRMLGSPLPPSADIIALFREGVAAELRGIAEISRDAELVSASCCEVCMAEHRQIFRIALELREPRLPHAGCPKGLCRCGWDLAARDRSAMRRLLRRRPRPESQAAANEPPNEA